MALTSCRECGAAVSTEARACMKCGARMALAYPAPLRPLPPRRPPEPERPGWITAAGWAAAVAGCALFGLLFFRASAAADRRAATEKEEMAREEEHMRKVIAWVQDTSTSAPPPGSAGRPVPTSDAARRVWVISRMHEEHWTWSRGILARHGVGDEPPAAWGTGRYQANARSYPQVETYLEGRVAAMEEIEKSSTDWLDERVAALALESGMSVVEVHNIFSRDFGGVKWDEKRVADAMLEVHRHLVRVDPRVSYEARGDRVLFEREDDLRRTEELAAKLDAAIADWKRGQETRLADGVAALYREIE